MYSFEGRIRYSECDETGRLSLFSLMNYLQDCSTFQSAGMGLGIDGLEGRGLAWVLANWRIEVDRLPRFGEDVTVSTWCYEMTRAHALRNFQMEAAGALVVRANTQWFVYDTGLGRATRVPEDQLVYLSDEPPLEMGPLTRRLVPAGDGTRCPEMRVAHRDLDTNHHVNNARYVAFALEALESLGQAAPEPPLTLQVQYRTMAFLGDVIVPIAHPCADGWDIDLTDGAGATHALVRIQKRKEDA